MNTRTFFAGVVCTLAVSFPAFSNPPLINYQGRLVNGTNLVQGPVALDINLYNAPAAPLSVYRDTGTVTVVDGLYSTFIGDGTDFGTLADALTNDAVFLEVVVNGTPLVPRERLTSVPYSFNAANYAETDPRWLAASTGYFSRIESLSLFATGLPVYAESDPVWGAAISNYLNAAQSLTLFATGTPLYVESDPLWMNASTGYLSAIQSLALFATGTPLYAESDSVWLSSSSNYLTALQSFVAFATGMPVYAESDPFWMNASTGYLSAIQSLALFATGTPLYAESDPVWQAAVSNYLTSAQSLALFATGTPLYVETDALWSSASNLYYLKTQVDALLPTDTPLYVESDPVWSGASSNYLTAGQSLALFATGTPLYIESDPKWSGASNLYYSKTQANALFATGTPLYVEADATALLTNGTRAMGGNLNMGGRPITNIAIGGLIFTNGQSVTQVFVKVAGDTMTGRLNLPVGGLAIGVTQLVVLTNGFVGIGTANPTNTLAVNGSIKAREVIVTPDNWPDYVFTPGYKLTPLADVEKFIAVNGHLPGVPSAKSVGSDGVALGEMQQHLLRKVEELTLYVIELRKENDELRRMVAPKSTREIPVTGSATSGVVQPLEESLHGVEGSK